MRVDMNSAPSAMTLGALAATFSVLGKKNVKITGNGGGNSVTTITDGVAGEFLLVEFVDGNVTLVHGNTANKPFLQGATNFTGAAGDVVLFVKTATYWLELTRNDLTGVPAPPFTTATFSDQITSTLADGTAPLVITSTTKVTNLNADKLDGKDWAAPDPIGSGTPSSGAFTTTSATGLITSAKGYKTTPTAVTATVDGLTTGIIAAGVDDVDVTSSVGTKLVTLPVPVVGSKPLHVRVGANGFKLQSNDKATVKINNVADGAAVLTVNANDFLICHVFSVTEWRVVKVDADGVLSTGGVPA